MYNLQSSTADKIQKSKFKTVKEILKDIPIDIPSAFTNKIDELKKEMLKNKNVTEWSVTSE